MDYNAYYVNLYRELQYTYLVLDLYLNLIDDLLFGILVYGNGNVFICNFLNKLSIVTNSITKHIFLFINFH